MFVVHFRNQQRHIRVHAKRRRVTDHWKTGAGKRAFTSRAMSPGKLEKIRSQSSGGSGAATIIDLTNAGISPARRQVQASSKALALRTIRSRQRGDLKLRMVLQQLDEALPDHAGSAKYSYTKFLCHIPDLVVKQKS